MLTSLTLFYANSRKRQLQSVTDGFTGKRSYLNSYVCQSTSKRSPLNSYDRQSTSKRSPLGSTNNNNSYSPPTSPPSISLSKMLQCGKMVKPKKSIIEIHNFDVVNMKCAEKRDVAEFNI